MNILKYKRFFTYTDKREEGEEEEEQEKKEEEKEEKTPQEIKQQNPESGTFYSITTEFSNKSVTKQTNNTPSYNE